MTGAHSNPNRSDPLNEPDWQRAHSELERLARMRGRLQAEEGHWLLCALRSRAHVELGYGSFTEYVERLFGYDARWTHEKLRVAEALEQLPELRRALANGELSWSAVRELTRVATAETEAEWLEAARGKRSRELERQVSGRKPGARPGDAAQESLGRHVLRFEVSAETLATVREAMVKIRRDSGSPLDDDAALLLMARHVLGGPTDDGRARYQVLLTVCEHCGRTEQQGRGELIRVGPDVAEMARCDAQCVRAPEMGARVEAASEAHVGRHETQSSGAHGTHGGCDGALPHAAQDVPPSVRRHVMRRDRGRCAVPGCSHATFVDVHHVTPRSEGGDHDPDGLLVLCAAHHRAVHRGQLVIDGRVSTGLVFRHADGRAYGQVLCAGAAEVWTKAFGALRAMGFSETQTRRALEKTRGLLDASGEAFGVEQVLRSALVVLTEGGAGDAAARARRTQGDVNRPYSQAQARI